MNASLREVGQDDQARAHEGEIFGRAEAESGSGQRNGDEHQAHDAHRAREKRSPGSNAEGWTARPFLAIWYPSIQVITEDASPGMLTRIDVVDPPYWTP